MKQQKAKSIIGTKRPAVLFALFFIFSAVLCAKGLVFVPFVLSVVIVLCAVAAFLSKKTTASVFCVLLSICLIYPAVFLSFGKFRANEKLINNKEVTACQAIVQSKTVMYDKSVLFVTLCGEKYSGIKAAVIYDNAFVPTTFDKIEIDGLTFSFDDSEITELYTKGYPTKEKALSKGSFVGIYAESIRNLGRIPKNERSLLHNYYFYVNDNLKRCFENISGVDTFSYASALLTGDRSYFSQKALDAFTHSGLIAVLCISGLHVVISSEFIEFFLKKLRFSDSLRTIILIIFLIFVMIITGGSGSVVRAAVMSIIFQLSRMMKFHADKISVLATAFVVSALSNPFCIFDTSTLLSYLAMTGIVFYGITKSNSIEEKQDIYYKIKTSLSASLHAQTFAAISVLEMFGGISVISPFSNLFVSLFFPLLMFMLIMCAFLCFLPLPLLSVLAFLPKCLIVLLEFTAKLFAKIPYSYAVISLPDLAIYCFGALFTVFLLSTAFLKNKYVIITGLSCFLFTQALIIVLYVLSFIYN